MMKSEYRRNGRVIVRRGLALSLGLWLVLVVGALPQPALADFDRTVADTISWFYAAAFGRTPVPNSALPDYGDIDGLRYWTNAYLAGEDDLAPYKEDVNAIADFFVDSEEFKARYPATLTHEAFVTALYENMLDRDPDAGGLAFWTAKLDAAESRGTVLADFANTPENRDSNPARKAALESFIRFIADNNDGTIEITDEDAREWLELEENSTLDGVTVDGFLTLTVVTNTGTGTGTVRSSPEGINCGGTNGTCEFKFAPDSPVTLTANAASDSTFDGWDTGQEEDECSAAESCTVTMSEPRNVTATFEANIPLTVTRTGTGTGTVESEPAGINCGSDCTANFAPGSTVTLTANAASDSTFDGWDTGQEEDECSGTVPCSITLSQAQARSVTATFNRVPIVGTVNFDPPSDSTSEYPRAITITAQDQSGEPIPGASIRFAATVERDAPTPPQLSCTDEPEPALVDWSNGVEVLVDRPLTLYAIACLNNGQASEPVVSATYEITNPVTFNDTGIDQCAENDRYGILPCPIARFPGQDAEYGRDAWARVDVDFPDAPNPTGLAKIGGGAVGFDFTRICGDGREEGQDGCLEDFNPADPSLHTGDGPNDWACTRDNVTGLMWEVKTDTVDIPRVGLRFKGWRYTWYENAAPNGGDPGVLDGGFCRLAGDSPSCDTQGYLAAINAISDIREGGLCGRGREWRLPTSNELSQLMHYGRVRPSMDVQHFPTVMIGTYWTSETYSGDVAQAWSVVNQIGFVDRTMKSNYFGHILAVSGSAQPPANENTHCLSGFTSTASGFSDNGNGNGTVTHDTTRLMWARCALGREWTGSTCVDVSGRFREYNWETALQAVASLNHGGYLGYPDWRIPSVKELNSIIDRCRVQPSINTTVFPDVSSAMTEFWSSSSLVGNSSSAWFIDFRTGAVDWTGKANTFQVLLVRDAE